MPVHTFVQVGEEECSVCPECSYVLVPERMRGWTETQTIMTIVQRRLSTADARTLVGSFLVANEDLLPSSQRLQERIADLLAAARVAGWRPPEEEERTMPVPLEDRREQLARQYSKTHQVSIERGRAAVLAGHDAPPVPVDPVSAKVEAKAREYSKAHGTGMDAAVVKVLEEDPALKAEYLKLPTFPSAFTEQTIDQVTAKLTRADVIELAVERKILPDDAAARWWAYDWLVGTQGFEHGTKEAADALTTLWDEVQLTRFKRHGTIPPKPPQR